MQKIEIMIEGKDEEVCATLINNLAQEVISHYHVQPVNIFCGRAAVKRGIAEISIPNFMFRRG